MRRVLVALVVPCLLLGCASSAPEVKPTAPADAGAAQAAVPDAGPAALLAQLPAPAELQKALAAVPASATPEQAAAAVPPPPTPRIVVTDTYHGVAVEDPYRWLETWSDPKVQAWSEDENLHARAFLDHAPSAELVRERITDLLTRRPAYYRGLTYQAGRYFMLKFDPAHRQQPELVVVDSPVSGKGEKTIVDPMKLDPSGHTAMDWFVPSTDGKLVAVSISQGGSENGTVHVYRVADGTETGDVILRAQVGTGGGSLAWTADSRGFFYTRYPREGERPPEDVDFYQQLYFHALGTQDAQDKYVLGKELPRIAEIALQSSEDGKHHLAMIEKGDGGQYELWVESSQGGAWRKLAGFEDGVVQAHFGRDRGIWLLSRKDAPKAQLLRLPLEATSLAQAKLVLPQQQGPIDDYTLTDHDLWVNEIVGGPSRLLIFDLQGKPRGEAPAPATSAISDLQRLGRGDAVFYSAVTYTAPLQGVVYDPRTKKTENTILHGTALADFSRFEAVRDTCTSKDGTQVPMTILRPKGVKLDGNLPVRLTGYGGFDISLQPYYSDLPAVLLEQGGVEAIANLRGGGEFGEDWHKAGMLANKQHVFDDFLACAQRLIDEGYTSPKRLAIEGGSNGGLLMGAALTQKPELFRAVVSHVGIYDMLRNELTPNGQFNTTEYGSVKDPELFRALLAYSPYQNVKKGTPYPAILFLTGANDPRVDPMHSRKMTAALQWASASGQPVLLRTSSSTGHGIGSALKDVIDQQVDVHAFLFHELGVQVKPVWRSAK